MTDLPNLQDIKADLADRKSRGWSVQHGEALVAALEAVIQDCTNAGNHPAPRGPVAQAQWTLSLIREHLTIGDNNDN